MRGRPPAGRCCGRAAPAPAPDQEIGVGEGVRVRWGWCVGSCADKDCVLRSAKRRGRRDRGRPVRCRRCCAAASGWLGTSIPILLALTEGLVGCWLTDVHRETKWGLGGVVCGWMGLRHAREGHLGASPYSTPSILSSTSLQERRKGEQGEGSELEEWRGDGGWRGAVGWVAAPRRWATHMYIWRRRSSCSGWASQ